MSGGFVLNLKGSGFEMMLDKGFRSAEELTDWMARNASGYPRARFDVIKVDDLNQAVSQIQREGGALSRFRIAGEKVLNSIPGSEFISKKAELIGKIGLAAVGTIGASSSAFAATGDFNKAARAGYNEGKSELSSTLNPENSFGRAWHNLKGGVQEGNAARASASLPIAIEGVGRIMGMSSLAEWGERDRVMPAAQEILRARGPKALVQEVIRTQENPKYIIRAALESKILPQNLDVPQANGQLRQTPIESALRNNSAYNMYMDNLEAAIGRSAGNEKRNWENQRDLIQGYRQALAAKGELAMPQRLHDTNQIRNIDNQQKNLLNSSASFPDKIRLHGQEIDAHIALRDPVGFNAMKQYYQTHNTNGQFNDELRTLDRFAQLERQRDTMIDRAEARGEINARTADQLQAGTAAQSIRTGFTFAP